MQMRHPITLVTKETHPLTITASNTCLLLQDVHAPFMDDSEGWLYTRVTQKALMREFDDYFQLLGQIRPNISKTLNAARELGMAVAYSSLGHREDEQPSLFLKATGWEWNLDGPIGAYAEEWRPAAGEAVFSRPGWSALSNPDFAEFIASRGVKNVIAVGAMLDYGIRQTCVELSDRGIQSLIVGDASFGTTMEGHIYVVDAIPHGLIKIRNTGELLGLLKVVASEGSVLV